MPQSIVSPLPLASEEYEQSNESITRRSIEQTLQEVKSDVDLAKTQGDKDGS